MANERTTRIARQLPAPPPVVYRALLDPAAVRQWKVPDGMTSEVHVFEAREGGRIRVSLSYGQAGTAGKTTAHTDTYHGHFTQLVPDRLVVEVHEFETSDPLMAGEMTARYELEPHDGGTLLHATHENVVPGVRLEDNELGWSMALDKLARYVGAPPAFASPAGAVPARRSTRSGPG